MERIRILDKKLSSNEGKNSNYLYLIEQCNFNVMKITHRIKDYLIKKSDDNIFYIIGGLIALCIIGIAIVSPNSLSNGIQNDTEILLINAQILATIFAITTSFTILGLQYVSQDLSPRIMNYIIESKQISFFFGLYTFGIISNLFIASFPKIIDPSKFLFLSYIILVFCILFLIVSLKFIIKEIQPIMIIRNIEVNIPKNFDETIILREENQVAPFIVSDDPFIELEQIIIRSIRNNDHASFSFCLQRISVLNNQYIEKIKETSIENGYQDTWKKTIALQNYFIRLYNQILFEILSQNNERFLNEYIEWVGSITEALFDLKCDRSIEQFESHFHDIGKSIISRKYYGTISIFLRATSRIIEKEFSNLPSGDNSIKYSLEIKDFNELSEKDQGLWYFGERTEDRFFSEVSFFIDLAKRAESEGFSEIFFSINDTLEHLVIKTVKKTCNESFQQTLIRVLLTAYIQIHEIALQRKADNDIGLWRLQIEMSNHPEEFNKPWLKVDLLGVLKRIGDLSIEYDDPSGIISIGRASRILFNKYPDMVLHLVDILIDISKRIDRTTGLKKISNQNIKRELISIKRHNKEKIEKINVKIDDEISRIDHQ